MEMPGIVPGRDLLCARHVLCTTELGPFPVCHFNLLSHWFYPAHATLVLLLSLIEAGHSLLAALRSKLSSSRLYSGIMPNPRLRKFQRQFGRVSELTGSGLQSVGKLESETKVWNGKRCDIWSDTLRVWPLLGSNGSEGKQSRQAALNHVLLIRWINESSAKPRFACCTFGCFTAQLSMLSEWSP